MAVTEQEIDSFAHFAKAKLGGDEGLSLDDLLDLWRMQHPSADDALAVKASIRDMVRGETGRPFEQFADEFRSQNNVPSAQ
jgi:hypothetical protein